MHVEKIPFVTAHKVIKSPTQRYLINPAMIPRIPHETQPNTDTKHPPKHPATHRRSNARHPHGRQTAREGTH